MSEVSDRGGRGWFGEGAQLSAASIVILHEILHMPNPRPAVGEDRGTRCGLGRWGESPPERGVA